VTFLPWSQAWQAALYGPDGFYRRSAPAQHFRTSVHVGGPFGQAVGELAERCAANRVVDLGAGRGELLESLRHSRPTLPLVGVDVVGRPPGLDPAVAWLTSPGGAGLPEGLGRWLDGALLVAHEWLDDVPAAVVERDPTGRWRYVEVDTGTGAERLADPADDADLAWLDRWWPTPDQAPGRRAEVGVSRDDAWADLITAAGGADLTLLAVDYGHSVDHRPAGGSLTGYRRGRAAPPRPDGSGDITAHVALDSVAAAGRAAGATRSVLTNQRAALRALGVDGRRPPHPAGPTSTSPSPSHSPMVYLAALAAAGQAAELLDPGGLGGLQWLVQGVGSDPAGQRAAELARLAP
jgi:SAM-dependent MidA family methyltransferase